MAQHAAKTVGSVGHVGHEDEIGVEEAADARDLYDKLECSVLPFYYQRRDEWIRIMQQSIALNASFFNAHRMVRQYLAHAYVLEDEPE